MSVRFGSKGVQPNALIDHKNLLNRGVRTHAELDTLYDEVLQARGAEPSLKAYIDAKVGNLTSNFMYDRQVAKKGQTAFSLVHTGVGYEPNTNTLQVYVNGTLQDLTAYEETDQFTVTFKGNMFDDADVFPYVVVFRVDGRSDGSSSGEAAERELVSARTNADVTPRTFADLKERLDTSDAKLSEAYLKAIKSYEKPVNGIPRVDLSSQVQASLDKADSAYQKPVGGIPLSDLADQVGDKHWKGPVASSSSLPIVGNLNGDVRLTLNDGVLHRWNSDSGTWEVASGGGGGNYQEVIDARKDKNGRVYANLKARLDDMQTKIGSGGSGGGSGGGGYLDIQTPINVMKNFFRDAEGQNTSTIQTGSVYVDVFKDGSGIDTTRSTRFNADKGRVSGGAVDITPVMTGPSEPAPYAATSPYVYSSYYAWRAFDDGKSDGYWYSYPQQAGSDTWMQIDMGEQKIISMIALQSSVISGASYGLRDWKVVASNDGVNFELLVEGTKNNDATLENYIVPVPKPYRYYRIYVLTSYNYYALVKRFKLYETVDEGTVVTKEITVPTGITKAIVTSEFSGAPTFDISLNDGGVWKAVELDKLMDMSGLSGSKMRLRISLKRNENVSSLGVTWFTDSTLIETPSTGGGKTETRPLVDVVADVNILKNAVRELDALKRGAELRHYAYADAFVDSSGIDSVNSSSYVIVNGKVTKTTGDPYVWKDMGMQISSSLGDYNNSSTAFRTYKATSTQYAVEKIADDSIDSPAGSAMTYWLSSGTSADITIKWTQPVPISAVILWMNGTYANGHAYCDHQISFKNPNTGTWEVVVPRVNLSGPYDLGTKGNGSWSYATSAVSYLVNEMKVTVWNKNNYMTLTEVQILKPASTTPSVATKPVPFTKQPSHLVLTSEYTDSVSFDLSIDGGNNYTSGVPTNQLIELKDYPIGSSIVVRAQLSKDATLDSLGFMWYDEDTLPTYTDTSGGSGDGGGGISMIQVDKVGVVASPQFPVEVNITIPETTDFKVPPVEILRFTPSKDNQVSTVSTFASTEAWNYDADPYVRIDGVLKLETSAIISLAEGETLPSGYTVYTAPIDISQYLNINSIEVN